MVGRSWLLVRTQGLTGLEVQAGGSKEESASHLIQVLGRIWVLVLWDCSPHSPAGCQPGASLRFQACPIPGCLATPSSKPALACH